MHVGINASELRRKLTSLYIVSLKFLRKGIQQKDIPGTSKLR